MPFPTVIGALLLALQVRGKAIGDGECGRSSIRASKIVSGEDASPHEFPWMVSFLAEDGVHFCGGFVVDRRHIISAAHCFISKYNPKLKYGQDGLAVPSSFRATLGRHSLEEIASEEFFTGIDRISLHPQFEGGGLLNNDIALIRTKEELQWSQKLAPICLPESEASPSLMPKHRVTVTGWGNTLCHNFKVKPSKSLKKVQIPVWDEAECAKAYREAHYNFKREAYMCAGQEEMDASKGDSGGPLMYQGEEGWTAVGIVSAGRFMCEDRVPGVYTKLSNYLPWIKQQIQQQ